MQQRRAYSHLLDERIHLYLPDKSLDQMIDFFWRSLDAAKPAHQEGSSPSELAWYRFVFGMIVFGGLAWPDALDDIFKLRYQDIISAERGYILIPRAGGLYPIFIPPAAADLTLSLCVYLSRERGKGKNRLGLFPSDGFILPDRTNLSENPSYDEQRKLQNGFTSWLRNLGKSVGLYVTVGRLISLSRARLSRLYSPPVASALLGIHISNPAPIDQLYALNSYKMPLDLENIIHSRKDHPTSKGGQHISNKRLSQANEQSSPLYALPEGFVNLRLIAKKYSRLTDNSIIKDVRKVVLKELKEFQTAKEELIDKSPDESFGRFIETRKVGDLTSSKIEVANVAVLSDWFSQLVRSVSPNTVEGRLNDIASILKRSSVLALCLMDELTISDLVSKLDLRSSSRERLIDTLRSLYMYMRDILGIPMSEIHWWKFRGRQIIREYRLLTQPDLEKVMAHLYSLKGIGQVALAATLLGYYFGLRANEICNLRICDLFLSGTPTIFVWRSKRGVSRSVEAVEIPQPVIAFLQEFCQIRLQHENGSRSKFLLINKKGYHLRRNKLAHLVAKALTAAGLENIAATDHSAVHLLRHACANRWLALSVPLIDIVRKLGHKSFDTTISNYLHIFAFLQKEEMERAYVEQWRLSKHGFARLAGITVKRFEQMEKQMFSPLGHVEKNTEDKYSSQVIRDSLSHFLRNA